MRLDAVEIKANVAGANVAGALAALAPDDDAEMAIWFYEDLRPPVPTFPLLSGGVVVRFRAKERGKSDSTVKLRPCDRTLLTDRWLDMTTDGDTEFTLEEDRSVTGSSALAASCTVDRATAPDLLDGPPYPVSGILTQDQRDLAEDCSRLRPSLDELTALGPVHATRWKKLRGPGLRDLGARAELWRVRDLEFLEVSVRVGPEEADARTDELRELLAAAGVTLDTDPRPKTERVLAALAQPD